MKEDQFTPDQKHCIDALSLFAKGRHHLPKIYPFGTGIQTNWYGDLSTYDADLLTRLVLVAHDKAVRISIKSSGPGMVKICAWKRQHGDKVELALDEYHPTLEDLISKASDWDKGISN